MAKEKQVSISDFKVDLETGLSRRVADFLAWLADQAPKRTVSYPELIKVVRCEKRKLAEDSPEIQRFKSVLARANEILREQYGREIVVIHGFGIRASVSDDDLAINNVNKRARRASRAIGQFRATVDLVDPRKITGRALRSWVTTMKGEANQLSNTEARLLLTAPVEE